MDSLSARADSSAGSRLGLPDRPLDDENNLSRLRDAYPVPAQGSDKGGKFTTDVGGAARRGRLRHDRSSSAIEKFR